MTARYTARALADIDQILSNIAKDNPLAASSVLARIEQIVEHLNEFPLIAHETDEPGVRVVPLGRYPYLIFYVVEDGGVAILHVRHAARERPQF